MILLKISWRVCLILVDRWRIGTMRELYVLVSKKDSSKTILDRELGVGEEVEIFLGKKQGKNSRSSIVRGGKRKSRFRLEKKKIHRKLHHERWMFYGTEDQRVCTFLLHRDNQEKWIYELLNQIELEAA